MTLPIKLAAAVEAERLALTVENISPQSVRIWSRDCAWGYSTFSLLINCLASPGDQHELTTKPILWGVNTRRTVEIESGGRAAVTFLPGDPQWLEAASLEPWIGEDWQIRVRLCIPDTPDARTFDVLIGEATSPPVISRPPHAWLFGRQEGE